MALLSICFRPCSSAADFRPIKYVRFTKWYWLALQFVLVLLLAAALTAYLINRQIHGRADARIQTSITEIKTENPPRIGIVFGAGVLSNGQPSDALEDRIITAVELYRAGRVGKLLMSGDNRFENYNEPAAMKTAALKLGVPAEDIVLDYAGRRTYDTCFRAKQIFEIDRAVLVTQEFHLPRSIYLCQAAGIDSIGIKADRRNYGQEFNQWQSWRETIALLGAWYNVNIAPPEFVAGAKEPIKP